MIVRFDRMMLDFNSLMSEIINFVGFNASKDFLEEIKKLIRIKNSLRVVINII